MALPRQIPTNGEHKEYKELKYDIYTFENNGVPCAMCYGGKRSKPDWRYRFDNTAKRTNYINNFIQERADIAEQNRVYKADKKAQEAEAFKGIRVGDIFHESGGWEQTNCTYYQLISLKGKTGTFRELHQTAVPGSESYMSEQRLPVKDSFYGDEIKARITGDRANTGYNKAYKTDPDQSHYCSWYA